jgi:aconitate hydratase
MLDDVEGGYTVHQPTGEQTTVFEASQRYREDDTPLVVFAGEELGTGSSRDWAAKGTDLLGVRATIAESYERIFRDNLVGMGVLPLQFADGDSWESLDLDGSENIAIHGLDDGLSMNDELTVVAERSDGSTVEFPVTAQISTPAAVRYVENGGILHLVLRRLLTQE